MQLCVHIGGEWFTGLAFRNLLKFNHHLFERGSGNFSIALHSRALLVRIQYVLKISWVGIQHNLTEHLDEAAIGIISETLIAGQLHQSLHRLIVDAQVQHRIHHPWH